MTSEERCLEADMDASGVKTSVGRELPAVVTCSTPLLFLLFCGCRLLVFTEEEVQLTGSRSLLGSPRKKETVKCMLI